MNRTWAIGAVMALGLAQPAAAGVLYDNGPVNGTIGPWNISNAAIAQSFTLTGASTVTGVTFGAWTSAGDVITTVDWGITSVFGAAPVDGTASLSQTFLVSSPDGRDVDLEAFSITPRALGPGTYWLVLQNAADTDGVRIGWDQNNGPSAGYSPGFHQPLPSDSFQILGTTGVPEPASWALMILGFGGLGAVLRRRREALLSARA